ncbi:MAG: type I phosphomannose isomerase catalytic subunit [Anaerolineae bacterium]
MSEKQNEPLKFRPDLKDKIWGGKRLERMYRVVDSQRRIGEAWLIEDTVAVSGGALAGLTLSEIVSRDPAGVLGTLGQAAGCKESPPGASAICRFPLLIKLLDASDVLSVQVHPDDTYAREREQQPFGKCEVWYVLEAEPGAQIIHGFKHPMSRDALRQAITQGRLADVLETVQVKPGDVVLNTPGTVHALGAGMLVYELQQSSDLTYRLYDWDRLENGRPRALHIEQSIEVADLAPFERHTIEPVVLSDAGVRRACFAATRHFAGEILTIVSASAQQTTGASFHTLTALRGEGSVVYGEGRLMPLVAGDSVVIPASLGAYQIVAASRPFVIAKAYVPDLMEDIARPLLARGISAEMIAQLGGDGSRSDLRRLLASSI